jgi:hypothetical protein
MEVQLYVFLTSALDEQEWSASRPGLYTPGKEKSVAIEQEAGRCLNPDIVAKKICLVPAGN